MSSQAEEFTKHTLNLSRFASSLLKSQVYPSYDAAYKAARLILLDRENINTLRQLDVTINRVAEAIAKEYAAGWQAATAEMDEMAVYESAWAATTVGAYVSSALNVPAEQKIKDYINQALLSLGEGDKKQTGLWAQFIQENIDSNIRAYDNAIRTGYVNGETVQQMTNRLRTINDGLLKQQAEALARTGVQHYAVQARQAMARANKRVLAREVPYTVFDNRRTIICTGIQAKYGEIGWIAGESPIGYPPYHVNCRTAILYLPKGQERLEGMRTATGGKDGKAAEEAFDKAQEKAISKAERDENTPRKVVYKGRKDLDKFNVDQIPADTDINTWLRAQPQWYIESTLGKTRADLFVDGKMDLAKFTDASNRPLTLAELKALDSRAFTKAGVN